MIIFLRADLKQLRLCPNFALSMTIEDGDQYLKQQSISSSTKWPPGRLIIKHNEGRSGWIGRYAIITIDDHTISPGASLDTPTIRISVASFGEPAGHCNQGSSHSNTVTQSHHNVSCCFLVLAWLCKTTICVLNTSWPVWLIHLCSNFTVAKVMDSFFYKLRTTNS